MESGKFARVCCFLGLLIVIIGLTATIVLFVVVLKPKSLSLDEELFKYLFRPRSFYKNLIDFFSNSVRPSWGYKCDNNLCKKVELTKENISTAVSLSVCRLYCNEDVGTVWPKPTGEVKISNDVVKINPSDIQFKTNNFKMEPAYWSMAEQRFKDFQQKKIPKHYSIKSGGKTLLIEIIVNSDDMGKKSFFMFEFDFYH
jgi:hypothetical protein